MRRLVFVFSLLLGLLPTAPAFAFGGGHWTNWARRSWIPRDLPAAKLLVDLDADVAVPSGGKGVNVADARRVLNLSDAGQATKRPPYHARGPDGQAELAHHRIAHRRDSHHGA